MAAITVRQLSDEDKQRLRERAAANGRSMEAEAREILERTLRPRPALSWIDILMGAADEVGGVDLEELIPSRDDEAPFVDFGEVGP